MEMKEKTSWQINLSQEEVEMLRVIVGDWFDVHKESSTFKDEVVNFAADVYNRLKE